jgi:hypothetical protein
MEKQTIQKMGTIQPIRQLDQLGLDILTECQNVVDNGQYVVPYESVQKEKQEIYAPVFSSTLSKIRQYIFGGK